MNYNLNSGKINLSGWPSQSWSSKKESGTTKYVKNHNIKKLLKECSTTDDLYQFVPSKIWTMNCISIKCRLQIPETWNCIQNICNVYILSSSHTVLMQAWVLIKYCRFFQPFHISAVRDSHWQYFCWRTQSANHLFCLPKINLHIYAGSELSKYIQSRYDAPEPVW